MYGSIMVIYFTPVKYSLLINPYVIFAQPSPFVFIYYLVMVQLVQLWFNAIVQLPYQLYNYFIEAINSFKSRAAVVQEQSFISRFYILVIRSFSFKNIEAFICFEIKPIFLNHYIYRQTKKDISKNYVAMERRVLSCLRIVYRNEMKSLLYSRNSTSVFQETK